MLRASFGRDLERTEHQRFPPKVIFQVMIHVSQLARDQIGPRVKAHQAPYLSHNFLERRASEAESSFGDARKLTKVLVSGDRSRSLRP